MIFHILQTMSARKDKHFFIIAKNALEVYCPMSDECFNGKRVFLIASKSDTSFNVGENPSRTTRTSRNTVRVQRAKRVRSQAVISARTSGEKVSSISLYSDISPVRQCWNRWFSPISALMTLT